MLLVGAPSNESRLYSLSTAAAKIDCLALLGERCPATSEGYLIGVEERRSPHWLFLKSLGKPCPHVLRLATFCFLLDPKEKLLIATVRKALIGRSLAGLWRRCSQFVRRVR